MIPEFDSIRFADPAWLLLLPVAILAWLRWGRIRARPSLQFGSLQPLAALLERQRQRSAWLRWRVILLPLAIILAITALARPQLMRAEEQREYSGIQIMIAFDVSRSMMARDLRWENQLTDRLEVARIMTERFVEMRPGDRIGLVAFAGRPYPVSPLTMDHDWLRRSIQRLDIGLVEDGTAIGSALAAAASRIDKEDASSKVIVLVTDGKNNSGQLTPIEAARQAAALGIRIYTIAVGTEGEAWIEAPNAFGQMVPIRIVSEFDPDTLQKIAEIGGGEFFMASETESLEEAFKSIDELEQSTLIERTVLHEKDIYAWVLIPAALLFLLTLLYPLPEERALPI